MSGLSFAGMVVVAGKALKLMEANGVEVRGGHVIGQSVVFTICGQAFELLAARGELLEIKLSRVPATDEISFHGTFIKEASLARLPDVRVMSVKMLPLLPAPATELGLVEAWGSQGGADKKVSADPDQWPVPF